MTDVSGEGAAYYVGVKQCPFFWDLFNRLLSVTQNVLSIAIMVHERWADTDLDESSSCITCSDVRRSHRYTQRRLATRGPLHSSVWTHTHTHMRARARNWSSCARMKDDFFFDLVKSIHKYQLRQQYWIVTSNVRILCWEVSSICWVRSDKITER
jgi:hypothetical protein